MRWRLLIVSVVVLLGAAGLAGPALAQPHASSRVAAAAPTATALFAFDSGLVLNGTSAASGAKIQAGSDHDGPAQRWLLESDGTIRLSADPDICLDVPAFDYASGVQLDAYTCKGSANQQFTRTAPSGSTPILAIRPAARPGLCLNVSGGLAAGAAVILYACGAATTNYINEAWSTTNLAGQVGQVPSAAGFPLNVAGGGGAGAAAVAWPDSGTLNEYWQSSFVTVSGYGQEATFQPVYNTAMCLSPQGGESLRAPLVLASCTGAASQAFATPLLNSVSPAIYFIAAHDARYCLNYKGGAAQGHPAILYTCVGAPAGNDTWQTSLNLKSTAAMQFGILGLADGATSGPEPVLDVAGTGSGSSAVIDDFSPAFPASQVWTDLPVTGETSGSPANPDGSISLHPLSDVTLCLTVPGGNDAAGQPLQADTCDGQLDQEFFRLAS
ncbi:MAG TPA: ricin-type beta-trefoil lectin domain protein, partial [Streptosporangiaceae bacterium]